jgi:hypothetical protein
MPRKPKEAPTPSTQKVLVPGDLLAELDQEAERYLPGTTLSRVQMVAVALREWLDARRAQREGKTK